MKLAGNRLNPNILNAKMKGDNPISYTDLLNPHYQGISDEEIQNEVATLTQECATCDDE